MLMTTSSELVSVIRPAPEHNDCNELSSDRLDAGLDTDLSLEVPPCKAAAELG